jgi:hypothetical protein
MQEQIFAGPRAHVAIGNRCPYAAGIVSGAAYINVLDGPLFTLGRL